MKQMIDIAKNFIEDEGLFSCGDHILIALSGGADSVFLLRLLAELRPVMALDLRAIHVHHGIRETAERDVSFAEELCGEWKIPLEVIRENIPAIAKEKGMSLEEAGRSIRYERFAESLARWRTEGGGGDYYIATAHHRDDQAETVLFHLVRGTGLRGLGGIRPKNGAVIRPLLPFSGGEIRDTLHRIGQQFCVDETNEDLGYSRNRIRHRIVPEMEKISAGSSEHIARASEAIREAVDLLDTLTGDALRQIMIEDQGHFLGAQTPEREAQIILDRGGLLSLHPYLRKSVLLAALDTIGTGRRDITGEHIRDMLALLEKKGNGHLDLAHGLKCDASYDRVYIGIGRGRSEQEPGSENPPQLEIEKFPITDEAALKMHMEGWTAEKGFECIPQNPYTKWIDCDKIIRSVSLRHRRAGDYLTLDRSGHRKSVKEFMIEQKIPKEMRDKLWLAADGDHIIWIPGYRLSAHYKVSKETKTILQISISERMEEEHE